MAGILAIILCMGMLLWKARQHETGELPPPPGEIIIPDEIMGDIKTFRVIVPERAVLGEEVTVSVVAVDKSGVAVSDYTGMIYLKSELLDLPEKSRFLPGDVGRRQFKAKAINPGTEIIEISDPANGINVQSKPITIEENF